MASISPLYLLPPQPSLDVVLALQIPSLSPFLSLISPRSLEVAEFRLFHPSKISEVLPAVLAGSAKQLEKVLACICARSRGVESASQGVNI